VRPPAQPGGAGREGRRTRAPAEGSNAGMRPRQEARTPAPPPLPSGGRRGGACRRRARGGDELLERSPITPESPRPDRIGRVRKLLTLLVVTVVTGAGGCGGATAVGGGDRFTEGGGSMEQTVKAGQVIITRAVGSEYRPGRGDIVLFHPDGEQWGDSTGSFLKRVIAVGGETIACCDPAGKVMIDGTPLA